MATENEVIEALKNLHPKSVTTDDQGRIIIKDEEALKRLEKLKTEDDTHVKVLGNYINCVC